MTKVTASKAYYIKLGMSGEWEADCLKEGTLRFDYHQTSSEALRGDWQAVSNFWHEFRKDKGAATRDVNQIRIFFEADETTIFITFAFGLLHWCHPKGSPHPSPTDGERVAQHEPRRHAINDRPAVGPSPQGADVPRYDLRGEGARLPAAQTQ